MTQRRADDGDKRTLLRRLRRVDALHQGATTAGEREAAARARARIVERLGADLPSGRLAPEAPPPLVDPRAPPPGAHLDTGLRMPSHQALVARIRAWVKGDLDGVELQTWARRFVDGMLLPDLPAAHVDSIRVEVILQLSSLVDQPLHVEDGAALIHFLDTPKRAVEAGWREWFRYVEAVDWHARRKARRAAKTTRRHVAH